MLITTVIQDLDGNRSGLQAGAIVLQGVTVDTARGFSRITVNRHGHILAVTTHAKIFDCDYQRLLHAAELLAIQGFDPSKVCFQVEGANYSSLIRLAGNGVCIAQLGALYVGLLCFLLPGRDGNHLLQPIAPEPALITDDEE